MKTVYISEKKTAYRVSEKIYNELNEINDAILNLVGRLGAVENMDNYRDLKQKKELLKKQIIQNCRILFVSDFSI